MLRATKPEAQSKRLKLFMYGAAGVGKTTAAIQFPHAYIIDTERGTDSSKYAGTIAAAGSVVFRTNRLDEIAAEVKALLTERHEFRTLVIDPITPAWDQLLEACEAKVGSDHGRHYGEANKHMKRLANLLTALDMNVVVTAHAKTEYGDGMKRLGNTFDGWRKLDYLFDLVVELTRGRKGGPRQALVAKSRLEGFDDLEVFGWSYAELLRRYGADKIEPAAKPVRLATTTQVEQMRELMSRARIPRGLVDRWFDKAGVDAFEQMSAEVIEACIVFAFEREKAAVTSASSELRRDTSSSQIRIGA